MEFVDWVWQPYDELSIFKDIRNKQAGLVIGSGLCMPNDELEFAFIPLRVFESLEQRISELYTTLKVEEHSIDVCSEVYFTSKIEGAKTTIKRTQQIHNGSPIDEKNAFSEYMVLGGFNATKILNLRGNRISHSILREVWEALTFGCCENADIEGTLYRTGNVQVGNHIGCNPAWIESAMNNWIEFHNSPEMNEYPFMKAALLHYAFEYIHPFCDGNGRMGRLLMNNFLIREGYEKIKAVSFSKQIDANRLAYDYAFMQSENVYSDCTPFIRYMLQQMFTALSEVQSNQSLERLADEL